MKNFEQEGTEITEDYREMPEARENPDRGMFDMGM